MSSPDINYPAQPSYGEGMADAMKAQMEQLLGQGDYADIYTDAGFDGGNLGDILAGVEAPIRQQTAQIDTDVLRQTLLGNQSKVQVERDPKTGNFGIPNAEQVDLGGEPGGEPGGYDRYNLFLVEEGSIEKDGGHNRGKGFGYDRVTSPQYVLVDNETGGVKKYGGEDQYIYKTESEGLLEDLGRDVLRIGQDAQVEAMESIGEEGREFTFEDPYTGEPLQEGDVVTIRDEDGMIDLLGDKRQVQGSVPDYEEYVRQNPDLIARYKEDVANGATYSMEEYGKTQYEQFGKEEISRGDRESLPTKFTDLNRQAGFDEQGNFLGLSALAEDVQAGNLSRQRERDLADVERLSGRFQDVMEDYKPGTAEAVTGAREVLESQKDRLTGEGLITVPTDDTFGGAANAVAMQDNILGEGPTLTADTSFESATVADPLALTTNTQFRDELGTEAPDTLRSRLLADAGSALGSGLTDREKNRISEAFKARSTMMGRTFDQSAGIAEAEARVAEDRARQAQNRTFVQSVLGQEAGLQQGDITRGMAQESEQAGLQQRADMTDAQFLQQARAAEMQAGMQQDVQQAGIDQERDVLQAQLNQQQAAFNAESAQQAALADQRQKQQAAQFGVGAEMDAERLNAQLAQQGALGYVDAATRLASLEDQTTMDPFAALLNRAGGGSLQAGQGVFGQAGYGLSSGPQYLNPESGLGYISQMAANEANMYGAQLNANAAKTAGIYDMIGSIGGAATGMGMKKLLKL
tara:strand:- start:5248 stop:7494 length:2247 start_codon:yes stop_codon:yes gene_type:complete